MISAAEKQRFYKCQKCGEMVDKRRLDDVLFHEDHKRRPDIQYEGVKAPWLKRFVESCIALLFAGAIRVVTRSSYTRH